MQVLPWCGARNGREAEPRQMAAGRGRRRSPAAQHGTRSLLGQPHATLPVSVLGALALQEGTKRLLYAEVFSHIGVPPHVLGGRHEKVRINRCPGRAETELENAQGRAVAQNRGRRKVAWQARRQPSGRPWCRGRRPPPAARAEPASRARAAPAGQPLSMPPRRARVLRAGWWAGRA